MARMLFPIKDRFSIPGHGVVAVGLVPIGEESFRVGDAVEIRRGDGTSLRTRMAGIEFVHPHPPDHALAVVFSRELTYDDLRLGAEVWSVDP